MSDNRFRMLSSCENNASAVLVQAYNLLPVGDHLWEMLEAPGVGGLDGYEKL